MNGMKNMTGESNYINFNFNDDQSKFLTIA